MITILHRGGGVSQNPKNDYVICARPLIRLLQLSFWLSCILCLVHAGVCFGKGFVIFFNTSTATCHHFCKQKIAQNYCNQLKYFTEFFPYENSKWLLNVTKHPAWVFLAGLLNDSNCRYIQGMYVNCKQLLNLHFWISVWLNLNKNAKLFVLTIL